MLFIEDESLAIADFGTTKQNRATLTVQVGTPKYFSPENVILFGENQKKYEEYAQTVQQLRELKMNDLYGIGQTFVFADSLLKQPELKMNDEWYNTYNDVREIWYKDAFKKIESKKIYSKYFINFLKSMVDPDPKLRPNLQQCLETLKECPDW